MKMEKVTQKYIRQSVQAGVALDVSKVPPSLLPEKEEILCYSSGSYGLNGYLYKGIDGVLYAIIGHSSNLYRI